jgi:hypothetical protein
MEYFSYSDRSRPLCFFCIVAYFHISLFDVTKTYLGVVMKPVSLQRTTCKNHPPTCFFFCHSYFLSPDKSLGRVYQMSPPPLLALYSNLQFWFSPSFFLFGLPRLLLHRIKVMMMSYPPSSFFITSTFYILT